MKVIHIPFIHFAVWPIYWPKFRRKVRGLDVTLTFSEKSKYEIGWTDQWDWNKAIGLDFTPFNKATKPDSVMIAWRFVENKFQYGLYAHTENYERIMPGEKDNPIFEAPINKPVVISIKVDKMGVYLNGENFFLVLQNTDCCRIIHPFFGGNKTPNKIISYGRRCKIR